MAHPLAWSAEVRRSRVDYGRRRVRAWPGVAGDGRATSERPWMHLSANLPNGSLGIFAPPDLGTRCVSPTAERGDVVPDDAAALAAFGDELGMLKRIRRSGWWACGRTRPRVRRRAHHAGRSTGRDDRR